jgi:hypothetical protein
MIKDIEITKDKVMNERNRWLVNQDETLQWVLYVIFAVKNERVLVI